MGLKITMKFLIPFQMIIKTSAHSQVNKTLQKTFNDIKKVTKCNISKKDTFSQINNLVDKQTDPIKKKQLKFILNWIQNNNIPIP